MPTVTYRAVFRRIAASAHIAVGHQPLGVQIGGETVECRVYDSRGNEVCQIRYGISREVGVHVALNFGSVEVEFQHEETEECRCPITRGDRLTFRSITILGVDILNVSFTHSCGIGPDQTSPRASGSAVSVGIGLGATQLELTALTQWRYGGVVPPP